MKTIRTVRTAGALWVFVGLLSLLSGSQLQAQACWQVLQSSIICDPASTGDYILTLNLSNSTSFTGEHAFVIAPATGPTITPNYFDLASVPPTGGTSVTLNISGGTTGEIVCFQLTLHDESLGECCSLDQCVMLPACDIEFVRGDCNRDGSTNIADAVFLLIYLFGAGSAPSCDDACDCNDDGVLNIADAIYKLVALFGSGPPPPSPNPGCGPDPTADALSCASYPPCP